MLRIASRFFTGVAEVPRMAPRFGGGAGAGARTRAEEGGIRIFLSRNAGVRLWIWPYYESVSQTRARVGFPPPAGRLEHTLYHAWGLFSRSYRKAGPHHLLTLDSYLAFAPNACPNLYMSMRSARARTLSVFSPYHWPLGRSVPHPWAGVSTVHWRGRRLNKS